MQTEGRTPAVVSYIANFFVLPDAFRGHTRDPLTLNVTKMFSFSFVNFLHREYFLQLPLFPKFRSKKCNLAQRSYLN